MPQSKPNAKSQTPKANVKVTKKISIKTVTKQVKVIGPKKAAAEKTVKVAKSTSLTVQVFDLNGKVTGSVQLPAKIFGTKPNKNLLTQALHVYFNNASTHLAHTKTRGEVRGGGRKPWKQKGTGNARAGSKRSPLWVGGGITFGPRSRDAKLELPRKMRKAALISALSQKAADGSIKVISGIEKIQPKTKIMVNLLNKLETRIPTLVVLSQKNKNADLASRNIPDTSLEIPSNLNAFIIWQNKQILISKEALEKFI
jgi:large subunit ribosomal protein L4